MDDSTKAKLQQLSPLVGQWTMEAVFPEAPPSDVRGHAIFQWGPGEAFLIQRWEVPIDEAPDGVAIIAQRFRGEFSTSGETIEGAWEKSDDGSDWEHDFRLIYRKAD